MVPYSARDLVRVPGLLSLARLPLAIAFACTLGSARVSIALLAAAGLSDVLDGWYARRFGEATRTGAVLDAVMDKLFVIVVAGSLLAARALSPLDVVLLASREVGELVIGARLLARDAEGATRPHPPHALGKLTTLLQYATVAAAVMHTRAVHVLAIATAVVGVLATIVYWARERRALDESARTPRKA